MADEILVLKRRPSRAGKSQIQLVFFLPIDPLIRDANLKLVLPNGDSAEIPADFADEVTPQEILGIDAGTLMWHRDKIVQQPGEGRAALLARAQADLWPKATDPVKGVVARLRKEWQFFGARVDGVA